MYEYTPQGSDIRVYVYVEPPYGLFTATQLRSDSRSHALSSETFSTPIYRRSYF